MMFGFKLHECRKKSHHDWKFCPYAHPNEKARRRSAGFYASMCPEAGNCPRGEACTMAHSAFEFYLCPQRCVCLCMSVCVCGVGVSAFGRPGRGQWWQQGGPGESSSGAWGEPRLTCCWTAGMIMVMQVPHRAVPPWVGMHTPLVLVRAHPGGAAPKHTQPDCQHRQQ